MKAQECREYAMRLEALAATACDAGRQEESNILMSANYRILDMISSSLDMTNREFWQAGDVVGLFQDVAGVPRNKEFVIKDIDEDGIVTMQSDDFFEYRAKESSLYWIKRLTREDKRNLEMKAASDMRNPKNWKSGDIVSAREGAQGVEQQEEYSVVSAYRAESANKGSVVLRGRGEAFSVGVREVEWMRRDN